MRQIRVQLVTLLMQLFLKLHTNLCDYLINGVLLFKSGHNIGILLQHVQYKL